MGSKRTSAAAPNMEFLRSENASKEAKCKEFWKYLDDKKTLKPYQPPKCTDDEKQETSSSANSRASCGPSVKPPKFVCNGAKPKLPPKKDTKLKMQCKSDSYYDKMFRKNVKLATYEDTFESLLADIDEYERNQEMQNARNACPVCKNVECICKDKGEKAPK